MIYSYGVTQQGSYHVKNGLPCQDAHYIKVIDEQYAIGAVADGLGSQLYTDIASKIAAEKSVLYCAEHVCINEKDKITDVIKDAFLYALAEIEKSAKESGNDVNQYDTTLALAVYMDGQVYYGNSGDSGIIVLNENGTYESITKQQRDDNGCVYPLCFGEEYWEFGCAESIGSVLLATDGLYETFFPYLLQGEEVSIYVALAQYMMSKESLQFQNNGEENVQKAMEAFINGISGEQVSDDKTVLLMCNSDIEIQRQSEEYYQTPDWNALKKKREEEYRRLAYPHLYTDEKE